MVIKISKNIFILNFFICAFTLICSSFFGNLWLIVTENYYKIPKESSIFTFEPTKMNEGSGGWWIYGEDNLNYYANTLDSINKIIYRSQYLIT